MNEIKFSCKDCVFAEYTSFKGMDIQYGCKLNRIHKLNPDESSETENNVSFFTFNRFCNARRPIDWLEKYCESDINKGMEEVQKEIAPRLSIIIKFDYNIETFKQIAQSLYDQKYSRKFVIIINEKPEYNLELFEILENLYKENKIVQYNILMPPGEDYDIYNMIDESVSFCKNGWIIYLDSGDIPSQKMTEQIDNRINSELKRLVFCNKKDNKTFLIQAALYKLIGGNAPKMLEDGEIDNRTFLERIADLQSEDKDCICEWGDVFNE